MDSSGSRSGSFRGETEVFITELGIRAAAQPLFQNSKAELIWSILNFGWSANSRKKPVASFLSFHFPHC